MSAAAKSEEDYQYEITSPIPKREIKEVVATPVPGALGFDIYNRKKKLVGHELYVEDARQIQREGETGRYLARTCDGVLLGKPTTNFDPGSHFDNRKKDKDSE
jgi:hypothetical protein